MELRVLGCSGGIGGTSQYTTSLLLDEDILIDAGTGVQRLSLVELPKIRHIFLTHSHLDHIAGLPLLVDTLFRETDSPVTVHALPETIETLKAHIFNWKVWPDFAALPDKDNPSMRYVPMRYGEEIAMGDRSILMMEANHTVPAAGYVISSSAGSIAFSGDTTVNDSAWKVLNKLENLRVLIVECAFANEERELSDLARHYCPEYLAADMRKLRKKPRVAITHLKPGYEERIMRECRQVMPELELIQLQGNERFSF
ncbi:MAG TPA: 3',5'-cyclic-nucleotide phosphodiesterase [Gammaproteobacteria bacterium]|nr:3',5'-cyclic-nucleotide phosphodiesterase [Gammaproteobacteria bacterium]